MKFAAQLAGGSILAAMVFSVVSWSAGLGDEKDIWFGMLGPTLASVVTWSAIERQRRLNPQKMLNRLIQAFVVKSLFFGVYIVVLVKISQVHLKPFIGCFAFFYIVLHIAEALKLSSVQRMMLTGNNSGNTD